MKKIYFIILFSVINDVSFAQWQQVPIPTTSKMLKICFLDSMTGFLSGNSVGLKTINGGKTWQTVFTWGNDEPFTDMSFPTREIGYCAGDAIIMKTINGGNTWLPINSPGYFIMRGIHFLNPDTGFVCGQGEEIWRTEDGGKNWTEQVSGSYWLRRFSFPTADTGYCVGDGNTVYKTTDGGITWNYLQGNSTPNLTAISFLTKDLGYVAGSNGYIARTVDGGITWKALNSGTSTNIEGGLWVIDFSRIYAVGYNGVIIKTVNGGVTWTPDSSGTTEHLRGCFFFPSGKGFVCGYGGTLLTNENIFPCTPSADFTFSRVQLSVTFQNKSTCANQYWWDFGDGFYSDDQDPLHFYNEPGTYTVCLTAKDTVTMNNDITCKEVTVLKQQIDPETAWTMIYPNPCLQKFWLKASDSLGVDRIKIFSSSGQLVWSENVDLTVANPFEISLNLAEAVYYVTGYLDERVVFREKLVVLY